MKELFEKVLAQSSKNLVVDAKIIFSVDCIQHRNTQIKLGPFINRGTERLCVLNAYDPRRCYKISHQSLKKQTLREASYFAYLHKKGIHPSFMPTFYGFYQTKDCFVLEQELFSDSPTHKIYSLRNFIATSSFHTHKRQLDKLLEDLHEEMLRLNVIVCDMRTTNILVITQNDVPIRIIIFDGYGAPEALHLPNYVKLLGYWKIQRQWKKFQNYYQTDLNKFTAPSK